MYIYIYIAEKTSRTSTVGGFDYQTDHLDLNKFTFNSSLFIRGITILKPNRTASTTATGGVSSFPFVVSEMKDRKICQTML